MENQPNKRIQFDRSSLERRKAKNKKSTVTLIVLLLILIGVLIYLSRFAAQNKKDQPSTNTENTLKTNDMKTVTDFSLIGKNGQEISLAEYKGKVLLIVNTATGCGFTPQYEELEAMYRKLKDKGFEIGRALQPVRQPDSRNRRGDHRVLPGKVRHRLPSVQKERRKRP